MSERSRFGVGFAKSVEAILATVQVGSAQGQTYLYPHEVRENLRMAGMKLDRNLPDLGPVEFDFDAEYEPDFGDELEGEEDNNEEDDDA